nr:hypothetical protein [Tanacetum cinerariifolium]
MLTMAENVIAARAKNRPPMLDKSQYSSWRSLMLLYIKEKIREAFDIKATNIVLQCLPQDIYNLGQHQSSLASNANQPSVVQQQSYKTPDAHHSSVVHHQSYQAPVHHPSSQEHFPYLDAGLVVPSFLPSDDAITSLNKATIQDGRVTVETIQERQTQGYAGSGVRSNATCSGVNRNRGTTIAGQLAEALDSEVGLDEEHIEFLADNEDTVTPGQESQEIPTLAIFQTDDLDAFDSDCDEAPSASAVLMAKLFAYDSIVLSEIPTHDTNLDNRVIDQKQAFWLPILKPISETPPVQPEPVLKEIPHELPTTSLVNDSFNKMRNRVNKFDKLKGKDTTISNLKKHIANIKGKAAADCSETINSSRVIALGIYNLDLEPLSPKLRKNRETHVDYLKNATKHANILRDIVEQARVKQQLDIALDYA